MVAHAPRLLLICGRLVYHPPHIIKFEAVDRLQDCRQYSGIISGSPIHEHMRLPFRFSWEAVDTFHVIAINLAYLTIQVVTGLKDIAHNPIVARDVHLIRLPYSRPFERVVCHLIRG